jgi:arginyl-tRNA synthetase
MDAVLHGDRSRARRPPINEALPQPPSKLSTLIRELLLQRLGEAVSALKSSGVLPEGVSVPVEIGDPRDAEHGDFACSYALAAAKPSGMNPRELAEKLKSELGDSGGLLSDVEVAGPGFLNFRVADGAWLKGVAWANSRAALLSRLERDDAPTPQRLNVEFVSVNPNGPITVGSGRGAAFGSTLCNVLEAAGHEVHREYYINDGLNSEQMRLFAQSVEYYILKESGITPDFEVSYRGDYVQAVASRLLEQDPSLLKDLTPDVLRRSSEAMMIQSQREDLAAFQTCFDTWFSEQSLLTSGAVEREVEQLVKKGAADEVPIRRVLKLAKGGKIEDVEIVEQPNEEVEENLHTDAPEGTEAPRQHGNMADAETADRQLQTANSTLWLRSTKFGDDMDRVLRRKDGRLTYIASDVAYHKDKFNRPASADKLITILGPDHHGYIGRLHAVVGALLEKDVAQKTKDGEPLSEIEAKIFESPDERDACLSALEESKERLEVIIFQIVRFVKDGKPAPMRKRDGNIYSLRDLMAEIGRDAAPNASPEEQMVVGKDVARFFYLMRSHDTHMDFDIDLATKGTDENPVFYVQYAHARICSVLRKAASELPSSFLAEGRNEEGLGEVNEPLHPKEQALIKKVLDLPDEIRRCAADYGVHRLTTYAIEQARAYHHFYDACRVIQPENPTLTRRRLAICEAARHALRGVLDLLGVSAPEKMERESA